MMRILVFFLIGFYCACANSLRLEKVWVVSRHNLRTPLIATLAKMTPKPWPKWTVEVGELTPKGQLLESYMGEYFSQWLTKEGLLPSGCPDQKDVHIYANTRQRTRKTGDAFTEGAFQNCNIIVYSINSTEMDPVFNPVVHNDSDAFKRLAKQEMQDKLHSSDLKVVYAELNDVIDLKNSETCKVDGYCDLARDKDVIYFELGEEPNVFGPFFIANAIADSFLMSYYEGFPQQDIAWGRIKSESQWKKVTKVVRENQNVRFNLTTAAKDIVAPLINYIKSRINAEPKFTLLVGHDSNLTPLLKFMGFKSFVLPEQHELTPIGSKLVFQKWTDGTRKLLKVEFVYQSWTQLRTAEKLSLSNPPKKITMEMKECVTDDDGFCPWSDFVAILNSL